MTSSRFVKTFVAVAAIAATATGHVIGRRAECEFSAAPNAGDTCESFAVWWGISLADLLAYNPTLSCPSANTPIPNQEWCIQMVLPVTTSTSTTPTSTSAPLPSPTQQNVIKTCTKWYKVVSGDTCQKIVDKNGGSFSLANFYTWNPDVGTDCSGLPLNVYVCVGAPGASTTNPSQPSPTQENVTKDCKSWYKVSSGDTCQKVVDKYNGAFSLSNFYTWNPDVGTDCSGLQLNVYVCVGVAGTPTNAPSTTPTTDPTKPSPTQDNVIKTCNNWYKVSSGDTCQKVVDRYGGAFSLATFYTWNPDVGNDCSGLPLNVYVCVGVPGTATTPPATTTTTGPTKPSPTQPNVIKTCNNWYKVVSGDTCQKVVDRYSGAFSLSTFYSWNPDVGTDCSGLPLNAYVCVGVPGVSTVKPTTTTKAAPAPTVTGTAQPTPVQSGVSTSCNKWYYVSSGDYCQLVADKFAVTLSNFYKWNPAIKTDCSNLPLNVYVCVSVK